MPGHKAIAIANLYVQRSLDKDQYLTIMPLMKYIYFAHGWTLGHTGQPLIKEDVIAWRLGPVIPEVYYAFREKGFIISSKVEGRKFNCELTDEEKSIVYGVFDDYSRHKPWTLSNFIRAKDTPWYKYRRQQGSVIPNDLIEEYYKERVGKMAEMA